MELVVQQGSAEHLICTVTSNQRTFCGTWGKEGELGYELYDHLYDREELNNLVSDSTYAEIKDSLSTALDLRIAQANVKPDGLGRQFENAKQLPKAKNITYGDLFDESGQKYKSKE